MKRCILLMLVLGVSGCGANSDRPTDGVPSFRLQLNWFHDPTFAGHYVAEQDSAVALQILEGGMNVPPLGRLRAGQADIAIVGIDIFLRTIAEDIATRGESDLVAVFVDLQRNPVGWIVHPRVARDLGMPASAWASPSDRNAWLFERFEAGDIQPGDKRGTETTSVWIQWRAHHGLSERVTVLPVGFDPMIMLEGPRLAYPVYLNEEPLKLEAEIGEPVVEFDPADDGIELYGNVVVTTRTVLRTRADDVADFQAVLARSWALARSNPDSATALVRARYPDVPEETVRRQVMRTFGFVFFNTEVAGVVDMTPNGRLLRTLDALVAAEVIPSSLTLATIRQHFFPFTP